MSQLPGAIRSAQTYEDYNVPAIFRPWAGELIARAKPEPGERILDVACGSGIVARLVAQQLRGRASVVGLDMNPAMIDVARAAAEREGLSIDWHVGEADALPFAAATFDLVLVQQGFQFFPDRVKAARELRRVLVPGGRAASATWSELARNPFSQVLSDVVMRHLGSAALATPFALGTAEELRSIFVEAGFDSVEIVAVQRDARFADPKDFVNRTITGAAAALPALQSMEQAELDRLVDAIRGDLRDLIEQHMEDGELVYPREAHIAVARVAS